jgi:cytochrome c
LTEENDRMKRILGVGAAALAFAVAGGAHAQAKAEDLLKANGCMNCHAMADKKAGPSLKDIAAKFKGKAGAEKEIVAKLKEGKGHPASKASDADLTTMVKFVLAQ